MIQPNHFIEKLSAAGITFFAGVPDSLLKGFITAIDTSVDKRHYIAANEGAALALAAGYHLATGELPAVYLQNSGLGNLINPLTSLTDKKIYGIPALLIIGWRGEPGVKDEPQHTVMGQISPTLLHQLNVPFMVLKKNDDHEWMETLQEAITLCRKDNRPVALLVESGVFPEDERIAPETSYELSAEDAIEVVYNSLDPSDIVLCTTGKIGRAFYKINSRKNKIAAYFLNVGSMGHAISIATGVALHTDKRVVLFDGDGALLMHMGALALPAILQLPNLHYILLNNGVHQSVGLQPTLGFHVDFCAIAKGCGIQTPVSIVSRENLAAIATDLKNYPFVEIKINTHTAEPLPRPEETPNEAKLSFMNALGAVPKNY